MKKKVGKTFSHWTNLIIFPKKMKWYISILFYLLLPYLSKGQEKPGFDVLSRFLSPETLSEGFSSCSGENQFSYHSLRNDKSPGLLTRCTTGKMAAAWTTGNVRSDLKGANASFIWLAALDLTPKKLNFDLSVNGVKQFTIPTSERMDWTLKNEQGFSLSFLGIEKDQHGDAHGYMRLEVPAAHLNPGIPLNLELVGQKAGDDAWMIVFCFNNTLAFLKNKMKHNSMISIEGKADENRISLTAHTTSALSGMELNFKSGKNTGAFVLKNAGDFAVGSFIIPVGSEKSGLMITGKNNVLAFCPSLSEGTYRTIENQVLIETDVKTSSETFAINSEVSFNPELTENLLKLTRNGGSGRIYLMNSSHQDIAWMDDVEKCIIERDTMLLTPLIKKALNDPDYRFDVEDALMLKEYIGRHPESKGILKQLLDQGKISCGSSFIQPYEEMYSGESLIRQFYLGKKWLNDEFGYNADTYWNMDVPGRTLQMPQILAKSGTRYLAMSRFKKGMFRWFSPDGSSVLAYSPGHYSDAFPSLQRNFTAAAGFISGEVVGWSGFFNPGNPNAAIPLLSDWDMSPAKDYSKLTKSWNNGIWVVSDNQPPAKTSLPVIQTSLAPSFFSVFEQKAENIEAIKGERPAVWLYIHGPSHQKAIKASREGDILLTMAEKFATVAALLKGNFAQYPVKQFEQAWEAKIYPDHGWGGKNGQITDAIFWQKYDLAKAMSERILQKSLSEIASHIRSDSSKGQPLVVFNSLNWERSCPVCFNWSFSENREKRIILKDSDGKAVPVQIISDKQNQHGSLNSAGFCFVAENVPSVGYKTYYVTESDLLNVVDKNPSGQFENKFYRIVFGRGGIKSIFDKELGKEVIKSEKFLAGEVFTMQSIGNGAGEFPDIQKPDMSGFDRTSWHAGEWQQLGNGPVFTSWKFRSSINHAVIEVVVKVYNQIKRIDFDLGLLNWDGTLYREFRMALPLNIERGKVAYEVPFGVVEVGKDELEGSAGERYTLPCNQFHPRAIENWIGAGDEKFWITLSSSVAVSDYSDPTSNPVDYPILQPILLASRKSCHHLGNEYLQTGDHSFSFSMTSHTGGWVNGYQFGRQANEKLQAVFVPGQFQTASLPDSGSFFKTDSPDFWISCIKKSDDRNSIIIRGCEWEGVGKSITLTSWFPAIQLRQVNLIENPAGRMVAGDKGIKIDLNPYGIETYEVEMQRR